MHLNDEQLLAATSDDLHLRECRFCAKRLEHLHAIRQQLTADVTQEIPAFDLEKSWQVIQSHQEVESATVVSIGDKSAVVSGQGWRFGYFAKAASLTFVSIIAVYFMVTMNQRMATQEQQLQQLIADNNRLQQQLSQALVARQDVASQPNLRLVQAQLKKLDLTIQQAYFDNRSEQEIIALWQRRKALMAQFKTNPRSAKMRI